MRDITDQDHLNPDECLEAIYLAVGAHSAHELNWALESSVVAEALAMQALDESNPVVLAAEGGDERLLAVFRDHAVDLTGYYGRRGDTLFHALAKADPVDTRDADDWLVERLNAGWLVHCHNRDGQTPLEIAIEHCRDDAPHRERLVRWLANGEPGQQMSRGAAAGMFERHERLAMLAGRAPKDERGQGVGDEVLAIAPWDQLARRRYSWSDDIAGALEDGGYRAPADLLLRWVRAAVRSELSSVDMKRQQTLFPNEGEGACQWLRKTKHIDPTLKGEDGLTALECALLNKTKTATGGWKSGVSMALAIWDAYSPSHDAGELAPRLPTVLERVILQGDLRETGSLKAWRDFRRVKPLWDASASMEGDRTLAPMSFDQAIGLVVGTQRRKAMVEEARLRFNTAKATDGGLRKPRL